MAFGTRSDFEVVHDVVVEVDIVETAVILVPRAGIGESEAKLKVSQSGFKRDGLSFT